MISDKDKEDKVVKYADLNQYTILANTLGALEYIKYDCRKGKMTKFLKWSKGSDTIVIKTDKNVLKIEIDSL